MQGIVRVHKKHKVAPWIIFNLVEKIKCIFNRHLLNIQTMRIQRKMRFSLCADDLCSLPLLIYFFQFWLLSYAWHPQFLFSCLFFLPYHAACVILVPWPGIKCMIPVVEGQSPNHWTTRKVPKMPIPNCLLDILIWISKSLKPMKYKATFLLLPVFTFCPP